MKQEVNKTINLDLDDYSASEEIIIGLFTYVAKREGWSQSEINVVTQEALRLKDHDHFIETIKSHCLLKKRKVRAEYVYKILNQLGHNGHYLLFKEPTIWDEYDYSNFRSLERKAGMKNKVFAIYTSDVFDEDKNRVTTMPLFFFDTEQEAQDEINFICLKTEQKPSGFIIHPLWRLPE